MVSGIDLLSAQVGVPYLPLLWSAERTTPIESPAGAMVSVAVTMLSFSDAIVEPRVLTAPTSKHAKQASKQIARAMASSPELVAMTGLQLTHSVVRWRCEVADHISGDEPEVEQIRANDYWRRLRACLESEVPLTDAGTELLNLAARQYRFLDGDFALKQDRDLSVYLSAAEDGDYQGMVDAREWQEGNAQRCLTKALQRPRRRGVRPSHRAPPGHDEEARAAVSDRHRSAPKVRLYAGRSGASRPHRPCAAPRTSSSYLGATRGSTKSPRWRASSSASLRCCWARRCRSIASAVTIALRTRRNMVLPYQGPRRRSSPPLTPSSAGALLTRVARRRRVPGA